ncbi:MAG TPA: hypothetical protein VGS10_12510 [Terracidiphilus sp.]|nr:hypothetical protein [Terracidiphilus sp.]
MTSSPLPQQIDFSFPHDWHADVLPARPIILPPRHYTYPREAEEVERGALEVLVSPRELAPFLATCALGFRDPVAPTGLWSMPHPAWLCAVSGGYAYLIDTTAPEHFTMLPYRPVLGVRPAAAEGLLLFVSHHRILAWGRDGQEWETEKLSDEGVTITAIETGILRGLGWQMQTDRESQFTVNLRTGRRS